MIAVCQLRWETYKPQLQEGSGRVQVIRVILIVSSTAAVTLKIDLFGSAGNPPVC